MFFNLFFSSPGKNRMINIYLLTPFLKHAIGMFLGRAARVAGAVVLVICQVGNQAQKRKEKRVIGTEA